MAPFSFPKPHNHHTPYSSRSETSYCSRFYCPLPPPQGNPHAPSLSHRDIPAVTISHGKGSGNSSTTSASGTTGSLGSKDEIVGLPSALFFWVLFISSLVLDSQLQYTHRALENWYHTTSFLDLPTFELNGEFFILPSSS